MSRVIEVFVGLAWWALFLGVPLVIVWRADSLPVLLVWPAWAILTILCCFVNLLAIGGLGVACALPYRGVSPMPGGPGVRNTTYHSQLQRRVGVGTRLDWANWKAGILLRLGFFFVGLLPVMAWMDDHLTGRLGGYGLMTVGATAGLVVGALVGALVPAALERGLRFFWSRAEPPDLSDDTPVASEGIGPAPPLISWNRRIQAWSWRIAPLPTLLLLLTALPLLTISDPASGTRWACLGLAAAAVLGYPVWIWGDHYARRLLSAT